MNERIDNLFVQARFDAGSEKQFNATMRDVYHKFAELIVRECARKANAVALDLRNHPELDGRKYVGDSILKAFGVEQ